MADERMWTIGDQGQLSDVAVKDWEEWLATTRKSNPGIRPPGTGPNGEWTVEDEQAAVDLYDEKKDYANDDRSYDKDGELREIWDILADEAGITGPPKDAPPGPVDSFTVPLREPPAEGFDFEAHADRHWALEEAKKQGAMGGEEDRVYQEMPEEEAERQALQSAQWSALLAQSAARKALTEEKRKREGEKLSSSEIQDLFRDDETVLYGEERDPQALGAEKAIETWGRAQKRGQKAAEKDEQAEYRADQRAMATSGYGKSIDNPYGKK